MTTIKNFIKRHPLQIYFILLFIISWGVGLIIVGPRGFPVPADQRVGLGIAALLGPTVAGILLTGLASGRVGYRELLSRKQFEKGRVSQTP